VRSGSGVTETLNALVGLRSECFVSFCLPWCFALGVAVASSGINRLIPLEVPYAMGLILIDMTPCAPCLRMLVARTYADIG
jgi:hypothetical protein